MAARRLNSWWTIGGVHLRIRALPRSSDLPVQMWWPLHRSARRAALEGAADLIRLDEFEVVGIRNHRRAGPLWIYLHRRTHAELFTSYEGQPYKLTASRSDIRSGRFTACSAVEAAHHAGLPDLPPRTLPIAGELVPIASLGPEWTAYLDSPGVHAYDQRTNRERRELTDACFASGRLVRWPLGPGGHRLGADQPVDRFGRCSDHRCARCYREPAASVDRAFLRSLHDLSLGLGRTATGGAEPRDAAVAERAERGRSAPTPSARRRQPVQPSGWRPILRQVWPPVGPPAPPSPSPN